MKKIGISILMVMLIIQSFISPIAASANSGQQSFSLNIGEVEMDPSDESKGKVQLNWAYVSNGSDKEEYFEFSLPEGIKVEEAQSGDLLIDGESIGTYVINPDGSIQVTILPKQEKNGVGTIEVAGTIIVEEPIPTSEEKEDALKEEVQEPQEEQEHQEPNSVIEQTEITQNILTSADLTFYNSNNEEVDRVNRESIISVVYTWEIPNGHGYKNGATFHFQLPEELKVYESINNVPIKFGEVEIGNFSVDMNGAATIVFNEFIENHSNIKGKLEVLTRINETITVTEDRIVKVTPIQ